MDVVIFRCEVLQNVVVAKRLKGKGSGGAAIEATALCMGCLDIKRFLDGSGRNVGGRWWSVPFGASPMLWALSKVVAFQPVSLFVELVWSDVLGEANERESKPPNVAGALRSGRANMEITLASANALTLYPGVDAHGVPSWRRLQLAATFSDVGLAVVGVQET